MKSIRLLIGAGILAFSGSIATQAQDKSEDLSQGFRAYVAAEPRFPIDDVRNRTGKMSDLVCEHGLNAVIAVFSRTIPNDASHPVAQLLKKQDEISEKYKSKRIGSFLVFLALKDEYRKDESRDSRLREISQFVAGIKPAKTTIALTEATETPDGQNQPLVPAQVQAIGIGAEDDTVVVFYNRLSVVKRWKFKAGTPPTEADLKAIDEEVAKVLSKK